MRLRLRQIILVALASFVLSVSFAWGAPNLEIGELLRSPAGRFILLEIGMPEDSVIALGQDLSGADPERVRALQRGIEDIRGRYLQERPGDRRAFEEDPDASEDDSSDGLRRGQRGLLRDLVREKLGQDGDFRDAGRVFRNFANLRAEFLAGGEGAAAESAISVSRLPERIEIDINRSHSASLYGLALANWRNEVSAEELEPWVRRLAHGDLDVLTPEVKTRLKALRKHSAILRSSFAVFSDGHEAPARLHEFVRDFGKLNDAIENDMADGIRRAAKDLQRSLDLNGVERQLRAFEPASRRSFDRYTSELFKNIRKLAARDRLPAERFHELRKDMKDMLTVFQLLRQESGGAEGPAKAAYDFLFQLNEEMGLLHDRVVGDALHGNVDYDDERISVPKPIRDAINGFLDRFENVSA